ncbi:MAG: wax ester/triacylglycerol synthase family O-acyltransferase [Frankiales bacterium]|nr:wax ester/triacylglycerol synthase family O-acyltransferase [Frankiales bacterium]
MSPGVQRMAGVDAGFLYMETPTIHMHTLKVSIVDVSTAPGGYSFDLVKAELLDRLHLLPPFRRRAMKVPFQLHHPVWVEDRDIDPDEHVFLDQVPAPGTMRELEDVIGRIASTPLRRDLPLWELHVCEGLADGRVAVVAKMHHALADGVAANALLGNITDLSPEGKGAPREGTWSPEPTPEKPALARWALLDAIKQIAWLPGLLWRTLSSLFAVAQHKRGSDIATPRPVLDTPRTSFNGHITARRNFATTTLPIEDFKRVKKAHGVTLNDVVLATVGGALRTWMDAHGEHPTSSLLAGVPMSTDAPGSAPRLGGNAVANMFTTLGTTIDDPVARLLHVSRITSEVKVVQHKLGLKMLEDWWQFTPPAPFNALMRAYSHLKGADYHAAPFNVVVSNVPGPTFPVWIAGARLTGLYSVGPILQGIGLNVTVWSYLEDMNFSLLACPDLLPDLREIADGLSGALQDLLDAS